MAAAGRILVTLALVAGVTPAAFACGYCIEDKMAAVYDYDVVTRAFARKHPVAFFALDGSIAPGEASRRTLQNMVESVPGVDAGSARISVESASLSAAFDPRRASFADIERSLSRKLATKGLSVSILRVMDKAMASKAAAGQRP